jgi:hypothetical protein
MPQQRTFLLSALEVPKVLGCRLVVLAALKVCTVREAAKAIEVAEATRNAHSNVGSVAKSSKLQMIEKTTVGMTTVLNARSVNWSLNLSVL